MSFNNTINLPRTEFPMRANLEKREPEIISYWQKIKLYEKLQKKGEKLFVLHDGPPYADGKLHLGHALNKILKDIIMRSRRMMGYKCPYIPGWDCHGMPIEHNVVKMLGSEVKKLSRTELRKKCEEYALEYVNLQREGFVRLGVLGDWANPYLTLNPEYEGYVLEVFKQLVEKGYIYRANKPIHWCIHCKTALAEAELEYKEKVSPSIYVRFPLESKTSILVWTTTPWTLPGNVAVAVHPELDYDFVQYGDRVYVIASSLRETVFTESEVIKTVKGKELVGKKVAHPIFENKFSPIVEADFVSGEEGTGFVHIAPGHGDVDFLLAQKLKLPVFSPVDEEGRFTQDVRKFAGKNIFDANEDIIKYLDKRGILFKRGEIKHSYPHCWRCHNPLIFRASPQWFMRVDHEDLRERCLEVIDKLDWVPSWSKERMRDCLRTRPDWCLSRQRAWGIPIPVFYCVNCGEPILDPIIIDRIIRIISSQGTQYWYALDPQSVVADKVCPRCGGNIFEKELDIFDVWFDSSSSFQAVSKKNWDTPVDVYLEAVDQHRGWFQLSLILSMAVDDKPPFKTCFTHGLILDKNYRKMSKSLGNVVTAEEAVKKFGADVLRLFFVAIDYTRDIPFDWETYNAIAQTYRKIRNEFRFMLGNLYDFTPDKEVDYNSLWLIDKVILHKLQLLIRDVRKFYETYEFSRLYKRVYDFFVYLSQFYFDTLKDRLYTYGKNSRDRRAAQTVLYKLLDALVRILAPIMPFTTEEVWKFPPLARSESVHLEDLPQYEEKYVNDELASKFEQIESVRDKVLAALETRRQEKLIGNSLEARVLLTPKDKNLNSLLNEFKNELASIFIVSQVEFVNAISKPIYEDDKLSVDVTKAKGKKCARCWIYSESVGNDKDYPELCAKCVDVLKTHDYGEVK